MNDKIFEIAHHFYRQGFFEDKEGQFEKHYQDYLKEVKKNVVEQIAQTYHDRSCMSNLTMEGQICECCESVIATTTSIEHDSKDYSKDLNVCVDCYSIISKWWSNNRPGKISPI